MPSRTQEICHHGRRGDWPPLFGDSVSGAHAFGWAPFPKPLGRLREIETPAPPPRSEPRIGDERGQQAAWPGRGESAGENPDTEPRTIRVVNPVRHFFPFASFRQSSPGCLTEADFHSRAALAAQPSASLGDQENFRSANPVDPMITVYKPDGLDFPAESWSSRRGKPSYPPKKIPVLHAPTRAPSASRVKGLSPPSLKQLLSITP